MQVNHQSRKENPYISWMKDTLLKVHKQSKARNKQVLVISRVGENELGTNCHESEEGGQIALEHFWYL